MNQLVKLNQHKLHVAHKSEVIQLRRALSDLQAQFLELKKNMSVNSFNRDCRKVTFSSNGQHHFISIKDIVYCEADGNYTKIFIQDQSSEIKPGSLTRIVVSKPLKSVIDLISSEIFIRCHQSYIINKNHVTTVQSKNGIHVLLINQHNIPVSRRNKKLVLQCLGSSSAII